MTSVGKEVIQAVLTESIRVLDVGREAGLISASFMWQSPTKPNEIEHREGWFDSHYEAELFLRRLVESHKIILGGTPYWAYLGQSLYASLDRL